MGSVIFNKYYDPFYLKQDNSHPDKILHEAPVIKPPAPPTIPAL
jgi:hypothetical protein